LGYLLDISGIGHGNDQVLDIPGLSFEVFQDIPGISQIKEENPKIRKT
jgi:hypothetical protein